MKVNKTLIRKWIHALESGNYAQGQRRLKTYNYNSIGADTYCCLGVLCDTIDSSKWCRLPSDYYAWSNSNLDLPPKDVMHSVGLSDIGETGGTPIWDFVMANDGLNEFSVDKLGPLTFNEIAEVLRMEHDIWD